MKECPHCHQVSTAAALVKCTHCGHIFERGPLEELEHLEYLRGWLQDHEKHFPNKIFNLLDEVKGQQAALRESLGLIRPAEGIARPEKVPAAPLPAPVAAPVAPAARPAEVTAARPTVPPAPPKAERPPFDWNKFLEKMTQAAVSGALLRGLLYLGAFMIIVSAAVLVVRFWNVFPQWLQLVFIAFIPTLFYLAGWLVRARLKLPQAGGVLTGIGAVLIAVDFAAVYQFGGLAGRVDGVTYWLAASVICTLVYALTAWRLAGEFFDYISLLAFASSALALTRLPALPVEWSVAAVTFSAAAMTALAARLRDAGAGWRDLARAARYLPQILIPGSLAFALFVPGRAQAGQGAAFLFAALGYLLLAWRFPATVFAQGAAVSFLGAWYFGLRAADLPWVWFSAAAAGMACPYVLVGWWLERRLGADFKPKRGYLLTVYMAGAGLLLLSIVFGIVTLFSDYWPGVIALALAALSLAGYTALFRRPILALLAGGLFILPFSLAAGRWLTDAQTPQRGAWLMTAWAALALAYLGIAILLRRAQRYAAWLHLWAHLLAPAAAIGLLVNYFAAVLAWVNPPTLAALGGVLLVYLLAAILHDSGSHPALSAPLSKLPRGLGTAVFFWPLGLLLPIWMSLAWRYTALGSRWLGAALAGLGLAYLALGEWLKRRKAAYRFPLHVLAYLLGLAAPFVSAGDNAARMTALYLDVTILVALAFLHRAALRTLPASLLFAWPAALVLALAFGQTLTLLHLPSQWTASAWMGLAILYLLAERGLARFAPEEFGKFYRWPLGIGAVLLFALGFGLTLAPAYWAFSGQFGAQYRSAEFIHPLLIAQGLGVALALLAASLHRRRWPLYIEPLLAFFPATLFFVAYGERLFGQPLTSGQYGLVWTGLGMLHLLAAALLDGKRVRYSHGLYLGGYALVVYAILWTLSIRSALPWTFGLGIVIAAASALLAHFGLHRSFDDLIGFLFKRGSETARKAARTLFLFLAVYALPIWLMELSAFYEVELAWRGLALALTAPLYVALGLLLRRVKAEYAWPFFSAGYALTAIGALVSFENELLAIWVLALDAVVYAASAYIFRQSFWLYLSNLLLPVIVLLTLHYNERLAAPWVAGAFMALAFVYFGIGYLFDFLGKEREGVSACALPFYAPGYLLSAVALAAASGEKTLAIYIYSAGAAFYALSAWAFRETLFLYPASWLLAVPYFLGVTLTPLSPRWYGMAWLPLILGYVLLGRFVFHKQPLGRGAAFLSHPAMPFYLLAYALSLGMIALSQADAAILTLAFAAATILYFGSALLFRARLWLYPGLLAAHLALLASFTIRPSGLPAHYVCLPFLGVTWAVALIGYGVSRRVPAAPRAASGKWTLKLWRWELDFSRLPFIGHLVTPSWAQPFFVFAGLDVLFWQSVALRSPATASAMGCGFALLLALFATLWLDSGLAYGTLAFFLLASLYRLGGAGAPFADTMAWVGGIGLGLYLLARLLERLASWLKAAAIWPKPLTNAAIFFTALAVALTLPGAPQHVTPSAAALAFAGALYVAIAYRGRYYRLGYLGVALLEVAWVLALWARDVRQPQWYAIPAGLYFTVLGALERRRSRGLFALTIEILGLAVLLVTSFIQSLDGREGFPYFVLLLAEGLLVIWWSAAGRRKIPFFIGMGASALNVVAQVIVLVSVYEVNRWFILLGVGVVLITAAVFIERRRERITAQAKDWREKLDKWE